MDIAHEASPYQPSPHKWRRRLAALSVASVTLAGASDCRIVHESDSTHNSPNVPAPQLPADSLPGPGKHSYVAMGDSFSSGEGDPTWVTALNGKKYLKFIAGTDEKGNNCHRSLVAYPVKVWQKLGPGWSLDFRACSGATALDFFGPNKNNVKETSPQVSALSKDTDLVTFTIGGNDVGFSNFIENCILGRHIPGGCQGAGGIQAANRLLEGADEELDQAYDEIASKIRVGTRVITLGYPRFFPDKPPKQCVSGLGTSFKRSDMVWFNSLADRLNAVVEKNSARYGFSYVDVGDLFQTDGIPHDECVNNGAQRWINRLSRKNEIWSFHPKEAAHAEEAKRVLDCYNNLQSCEPSDPLNPLRKLGKALPLALQCDLRDEGQHPEVVGKVTYLDATHDGLEDALVRVRCSSTTSSNPEEVEVFDGASPDVNNPKMIGALLRQDAQTLLPINVKIGTENGNIRLTGDIGNSAGGTAQPSDTFVRNYAYQNGQFVEINAPYHN